MKLISALLVLVFATAAHTQETEETKRKDLWAGLFRELPDDIKKIDVYAENASITAICFRAQGRTYLFEGNTNSLTLVNHAKALPKGSVNQITFFEHEESPTGVFILWGNGQRLLSVGIVEK